MPLPVLTLALTLGWNSFVGPHSPWREVRYRGHTTYIIERDSIETWVHGYPPGLEELPMTEGDGHVVERLTRENMLLRAVITELEGKLESEGRRLAQKLADRDAQLVALEAEVQALIVQNDGLKNRLEKDVLNIEIERLKGLLRNQFKRG